MKIAITIIVLLVLSNNFLAHASDKCPYESAVAVAGETKDSLSRDSGCKDFVETVVDQGGVWAHIFTASCIDSTSNTRIPHIGWLNLSKMNCNITTMGLVPANIK